MRRFTAGFSEWASHLTAKPARAVIQRHCQQIPQGARNEDASFQSSARIREHDVEKLVHGGIHCQKCITRPIHSEAGFIPMALNSKLPNATESPKEKSGLELWASLSKHRRKYRNRPCVVDGIRFDSIAEAKRFNELKLFVAAGEISNLELQPKFPLVVNGGLVCVYIADFSYSERGYRVVEDVKSPVTRTAQYRIKVKLLKALTGIVVREVA
jgi:hypothetical protein